jgi:hypothetical protein
MVFFSLSTPQIYKLYSNLINFSPKFFVSLPQQVTIFMETNEHNKQVWRKTIIECIKILRTQGHAMPNFINTHKKTRKNIVTLLLIRRILTNIRAVLELAGYSYKKQGALYFKLPVGLLLRNCLTDSITGLYFLTQDDKTTGQLLDLQNHDYAKALLSEFEVYRDKIKISNFSDELAEHFYTLNIEDTFLSHFDINEDYKEIEPLNERHMWKAIKSKDYLPDGPNDDPDTKRKAEALSQHPQFGSLADSLFAYYKYFSQWEHFSENGTGDILANFGEDNIKLPMTFGHISQALDYLLKPVES